ncbi:MAG: putative Ig domain-containing protein [Verrucomicrobiota bacterium]
MKPEIHAAIRLLLLVILLNFGRASAAVYVTVEPGDQTVAVGENATFAAIVTATAGETITGYQWLMSTNNLNFTTVGGAAALVINNVQTTDAGYYFVNVTYLSGGSQNTLASSTVQLTVDPRPRIITQPVSVTSPLGSNAVFTVTVGGAPPLHYQWQFNGSNLRNTVRITGSATTNLEIQNLTSSDTGNYQFVVTNLYGAATSQVVTLFVSVVPPVITSAGTAAGQQGHAFDFAITATGTAPITFGASGLPDGLSLDWTNGVISGVPSVAGVFDITLFATNAAQITVGDFVLTLADDIPGITSVTNAVGLEGALFSYTITATNDPAWFSAGPLPTGLSVDTNNGVISGVPLVSGVFAIAIGVANHYGSNSVTLTLDLAPGAPIITSSLQENGQQGQSFTYTITASNSPASFSASPLPLGLNLDAASGVISGVPLVSGPFTVTIGAQNEFGSGSQTLTLNLASGAPGITSALTARGTEEQLNFRYTITASNSPTAFWADGLPMGLSVNTNTGAITGAPLYAGTYAVPLFAANAWGVGAATLQLTIANRSITGLFITNVMTNYLSPYLVQFTFSLRDGTDPLTSQAVVASPALMTVTAFEDNVRVIPSETSVILQGSGTDDSKVLKTYLVLDFTESIASPSNGTNADGISDAVTAEVAAAQDFVNQQPATAQIGIYEFHRDDEPPQQVSSLTVNKAILDNDIAGIWTNYVKGFSSGSRAWDAVNAAITALGPVNSDEIHSVVLMSDGGDDSSMVTITNVTAAATNDAVQIYAIGFGYELDTNSLEFLTSATLGSYYTAANLSDLDLTFGEIGKDLDSQYTLRWATLSRSKTPFVPSFEIAYEGLVADSPTNQPPFVIGTNDVVETNNGVVSTNDVLIYQTNYIMLPFPPPAYAGNVLGGSLRLVADADVEPSAITLRATYVPRYIGQMRLHYRANWPVSLSLASTNPGEILAGWTLSQTNDGGGGQWALLSSPDPANPAGSIPFAAFGDLLTFSFQNPITSSNAFTNSNAFSLFAVDNTLYSTNIGGTNFYGFTLTNASSFITVYTNPPPHGTPIPWLISYGFTNNFAAAELEDPNQNGLEVWQDYLAGLNPRNTNSTFAAQLVSSQNVPQVVFNTVLGQTYQIDWAVAPDGPWMVLRDGIAGTGGDVTFTDLRDLSSVGAMFYRVAVDDP